MTEAEKLKFEEMEAVGRQVFDPGAKTFNYNKQRVTDMPENTRVTLPRPLKPESEAAIEIRRSVHTKTFKEFMDKYCDKNGEQFRC